MALPLMIAGGMAGLSIASSLAGNKQAEDNAESQAKFLLQNFRTTTNAILNTRDELDKQAGIELTQLQLEGMKNQATTSNVIVEKEVSGAVAERLYNNSDMQEALLSNQIKQKAESNMLNMQQELTSTRYSYESGMMSNATNLANNTQSTLGITASAVGAGAQGYMLGKGIANG